MFIASIAIIEFSKSIDNKDFLIERGRNNLLVKYISKISSLQRRSYRTDLLPIPNPNIFIRILNWLLIRFKLEIGQWVTHYAQISSEDIFLIIDELAREYIRLTSTDRDQIVNASQTPHVQD